jgi:hypothetical protein
VESLLFHPPAECQYEFQVFNCFEISRHTGSRQANWKTKTIAQSMPKNPATNGGYNYGKTVNVRSFPLPPSYLAWKVLFPPVMVPPSGIEHMDLALGRIPGASSRIRLRDPGHCRLGTAARRPAPHNFHPSRTGFTSISFLLVFSTTEAEKQRIEDAG